MSEVELHQLIAMHVTQIDSAFEFWLTISFGVLMAIHIVGRTMLMPFKVLICILYVAASLISILMTIGDMAQAAEFVKSLDSNLPGTPFNAAAQIIRLCLYTLGTAIISIAIFRYRYWVGSNDT